MDDVQPVLELCHSRWFYYIVEWPPCCKFVLELCHSRWFYYPMLRTVTLFAFWNYVIPDGSTTEILIFLLSCPFWNYVIPDGSTTERFLAVRPTWFWNYVIPDGSTTSLGFHRVGGRVLELCHSRWFYYLVSQGKRKQAVLELCHSRWFYYKVCTVLTLLDVLELCHSRCFYYTENDVPF